MLDPTVNEAKDFWTEKISGNLSATSLTPDYHNQTSEKTGSETMTFNIPVECQKLIVEKTNDSPFLIYTVLMAALNICLYKYTKSEEIVVGSPARVHEESEQAISNALPIINIINPAQSVKEFLKIVRNSLVEAYKYQHYDYENMINQLEPESDSDRFQLFDISLAFSSLHSDLPNVNNNINLIFSKDEDDLEGTITFKSKAYQPEKIERFAAHLVTALTNTLKNLDAPIALIEILPEEERRRQIEEWSGRNDVIDKVDRTPLTAAALFERQVDRTPDHLAVVSNDVQMSYAELEASANRLARYLRAKKIGLEDRVGIMLERSSGMLTAVLAVFKSGAVYVPLDAGYPAERLAYMIEDAEPSLIITEKALEEQLPWTTAEVVRLDEIGGEVESQSAERLEKTKTTVENEAYMIYTSGSTGKPKGVMVTHAGLRTLAEEQGERFGVSEESRVLQFASLSFDASVSEIIVTLANGGTLCLASRENLRSGSALSQIIEQMNIEIATLPPALLSVISPDENWGLKTIVAAGETCNPKIVEEWAKERKFLNAYGPTEATVCATIWEYDGKEIGENVPIGRPIKNTEVYLLDERMNLVPTGVAGELYLGGAGLARGYWNRAGLTAERFVPHPFGKDGERLYRTGDVGRYLGDGQIEYLGRADRQVKIRGYRVELGEIEGQIRMCPPIADTVVEIITEVNEDKQLACYYVRREAETEISPDIIKQYLKEKLPDYMIPLRYLELENIPLTANGKVDYKRLAEFSVKDVEIKNIKNIEMTDPAVELLIGIWEELLGTTVTDLNNNFFELGGHSLLATQLISRIRDTFGAELELGVVFDHPQIDLLAKRIIEEIGTGGASEVPPILSVSKDQPLPLSFAQQRMWFLNQFEGGSGNYNISFSLLIKGEINIPALEKSLSLIQERHEILRTKFDINNDGSLFQLVEPPQSLKLNIIDISDLPREEAEEEARRLTAENARFQFDLASGKSFSLNLIKLAAEERVLMITMHHIVSDGWSTGIFIRELAAAYSAFLSGSDSAAPDLPDLPVQYADYAVWQREYLSAQRLAAQLDFWRGRLGAGGGSAALDLPLDYPRPLVRSFSGAKRWIELTGDLTARLREVSRAANATLFMTLTAAFKILLARTSRQTDISVGIPVANRSRGETENLIGFFVNTLVIRSEVDGADSFGEYLERIRRGTLEAYANQDIPFEKLVEELRPERDMSRTPLFQVMMVMQNAGQEKLELPGMELSGFGLEQKTAKFDLTLTIDEAEGEGLAAGMEYNTDLFTAETIERLLHSFHQLLVSITTDTTQKIQELKLLPEEERRRQIEEWSGRNDSFDSVSDYPLDELRDEPEEPRLTAAALFERQVDRTPDHTAVVTADGRMSYAELDESANRLARYLRAKKIGTEDRVGIMLERSSEMVTAVLAVFKCGAVYVPLDAGYPAERLAYMIEDSEPSLIITEKALEEQLPWTTAEVVRLDEIGGEVESQSAERLTRNEAEVESQSAERLEKTKTTVENGAYMIYTSGSTGKPKGVMVTHAGLRTLAEEQGERFGVSEESRVLQFASLSFDASIFDISMAVFNGGTLYLTDRETILPGQRMADYLRDNKISIMTLTPTALAALPFTDLPFLKVINVAGEACSLELAERWSENREFLNLYGPTEATIWATVLKFEKDAERMSIGRPIRNTEAYLLDERMNLVPAGVAGEIYLGGAGLARGYWNRAGLTAERFVPHPFGRGGERLYRTGDLGKYLADGRIEYLGRADRQVKIRGYRVELGEIETTLRTMENIREAIVEAAEDEKGNMWLTAYLVSDKPDKAEIRQSFNITQIREYLQERLPNFMIPARFILLESLPLLPNGKLDRKNLPKANNEEVETGAEYQPPSTEAETKIAEIWSEVLNLKKVGVEDNFFTLGGHSLLLAQVHAKLVQEFEKEISLIDLFKYPTIKTLANYITQENMPENAVGRGQERAESRLELRNQQAALRKRVRETKNGK